MYVIMFVHAGHSDTAAPTMPTPHGGNSSTKKRRQRKKRAVKRLQKTVKELQKQKSVLMMQAGKQSRVQLRDRKKLSTTRILPEFVFDKNVKVIPEGSVKELQLTACASGKNTEFCTIAHAQL